LALIDPHQRIRKDIPDEDAWVEVRPLTQRDIHALQLEAKAKPSETNAEYTMRILERAITAWSYDAPICHESFEALDAATFVWLDQNVLTWRPEQEKKDSEPPSSPTTAPAADLSPVSSAI